MNKSHQPNKRKKAIFFMILGGVLIAAAGTLLGYNELSNWQALQYSKEAVIQLQEMMEAEGLESEESNALEDEENLDEDGDYILAIDGTDYVGILVIEELGLELPVQAELSYAKLKNTPCLYAGGFSDNTAIIGAHNYEAHFRNLKELEIGSSVVFVDVTGYAIAYEVGAIEMIDGTEVDSLLAGEWDLTLFTCNILNNTQRVVVRCNRVI